MYTLLLFIVVVAMVMSLRAGVEMIANAAEDSILEYRNTKKLTKPEIGLFTAGFIMCIVSVIVIYEIGSQIMRNLGF